MQPNQSLTKMLMLFLGLNFTLPASATNYETSTKREDDLHRIVLTDYKRSEYTSLLEHEEDEINPGNEGEKALHNLENSKGNLPTIIKDLSYHFNSGNQYLSSARNSTSIESKRKNYENAVVEFEKCIKLIGNANEIVERDSVLKIHLRLFEAYNFLEDYENVIKVGEKIKEMQPNSNAISSDMVNAYYKLAVSFDKLGDYKSAAYHLKGSINVLENALQLGKNDIKLFFGDDIKLFFEIGKACDNAGVAHYEIFFDNPNDYDFIMAKHFFEKANRYLKKANAKPDSKTLFYFARNYYNLGVLHFNLYDKNQNEGDCLLAGRNFLEAIAFFDKAEASLLKEIEGKVVVSDYLEATIKRMGYLRKESQKGIEQIPEFWRIQLKEFKK